MNKAVFSVLLLNLALMAGAQAETLQKQILFKAGEGDYFGYRIPALALSRAGTLLAFCEGRKASLDDTGDIDTLLRRSTDGGKSWGPVQVVGDAGPDVCGNPCPVVVRETGDILLLLTQNKGDGPEGKIVQGEAPPRTVWLTRSHDDGLTWSPLVEISESARRPGWRWYATGPGHGIQTRSGRIVIPCNHTTGPEKRDMHSHVIYSDDKGATWAIGGVQEWGTNESTVVELADGRLCQNMRNYRDKNARLYATSKDEGLTWSPVALDDALIEPVCQASILRHRDCILFSNPASTRRERMTVKVSHDECDTWSTETVLHAGPAAYSDLAVLADNTIGCLYECGEKTPYETITLAVFTLENLAE